MSDWKARHPRRNGGGGSYVLRLVIRFCSADPSIFQVSGTRSTAGAIQNGTNHTKRPNAIGRNPQAGRQGVADKRCRSAVSAPATDSPTRSIIHHFLRWWWCPRKRMGWSGGQSRKRRYLLESPGSIHLHLRLHRFRRRGDLRNQWHGAEWSRSGEGHMSSNEKRLPHGILLLADGASHGTRRALSLWLCRWDMRCGNNDSLREPSQGRNELRGDSVEWEGVRMEKCRNALCSAGGPVAGLGCVVALHHEHRPRFIGFPARGFLCCIQARSEESDQKSNREKGEQTNEEEGNATTKVGP